MKRIAKILVPCGVFAAALVSSAQATVADASGVVTTASNTIDTVTGVISGVVGFFIIVSIVKWVKKH